MTDDLDPVDFDDLITVALAHAAAGATPRVELRDRLMARLAHPPVPDGFAFRWERDQDWTAHPVPGIRMKVLSRNERLGYATLLLDVAPGTRFPAHHHDGAEECYVVSGSLHTCGRRLEAGDFVHADGNTDHDELYTEEGCRVILVVPPEDYMV